MNLENITNSQIAYVIDEYIHSQRDREILKDRYINGLTFDCLSEKHFMSTVQVKRIVYKQSEILFRHL